MRELLSALTRLPEQVATLFVNPTSNLQAAYALYAMIALVVLIVVVVAIMALMSASDEEPEDGSGTPDLPTQPASPATPRPPRSRRARLVSLAIGFSVLAAVWGLTGQTTSTPSACAGCHSDSPHAAKGTERDPHSKTPCVACHESGGAVGRYVLGVPSRVLHVAGNIADVPLDPGYGRVTASACSACHGEAIARTTVDQERGLRMSHEEPLAASASCLDCHPLSSGVVTSRDMGMGPCLRCHDSDQASAACDTCHDKKASSAARARRVTPEVRVETVKCGGCHDEKKECDSCHGARMPHSKAFMVTAHARAGAVDLWYNGGKACSKCHTPTRRPCTKCHSSMLGQGHGASQALTHQQAVSSSCDTCHLTRAVSRTRDFCVDVCHTPEAIAESPR